MARTSGTTKTPLPKPLPVDLWTTQDLADWLKVSKNAVHIMMSRGAGPHGRKVGREWRFDPADISAWWQAQPEGKTA
jgi:Helix-turn-helix domain